MANGLSVLLGLARQPGSAGQIPRRSPEEEQLDELIPEEDLFAAQDVAIERGRTSGRPFAVPSRESLRESARGRARVGIQEQQSALMRALLPAQVSGEYGLQRERIAQEGAVRAAGARAERDTSRRREEYAQQLLRDRLNQAAIAERTGTTQAAIAERSAETRSGAEARQRLADRLMRGRALEAEARKVTGLGNLFTGRREQLQQEAAQLRGDVPEAQEAAVILSEQFPGQSLEDLIASGVVEVDSDAELSALQAAFAALQGQ